MSNDSRILVVSNRLPINIFRKDINDNSIVKANGYTYISDNIRFDFVPSSGGLVSAFAGLKKSRKFLWIGWTGSEITDKKEQEIVKKVLLEKYGCVPVFLNKSLVEKYYDLFSNGVLWPLLHYNYRPSFDLADFKAYCEANLLFSNVINETFITGDYIWVNDYQLMMVPTYLRESSKKTSTSVIGWFLHTPWPSSEIFRILPFSKELYNSLLTCTMLSFHTHDYAAHFVSGATRILGLQGTADGVVIPNGNFVSVSVCPIGIDSDEWIELIEKESIKTKIEKLKNSALKDCKKVLLGVDRLDYIKGIDYKLRGFERFLDTHPEWVGKVCLIQIAVPSRVRVSEYINLKEQIEYLVGRINGKFGWINYVPVRYIFNSTPKDDLTSLYAISDALVVSSLRDGMNLVAFEYIMCQTKKEKPGCLILSEFTGAAASLSGALLINPYNENEVSSRIFEALEMSNEELIERQTKLHNYVTYNTASHWGNSFFSMLLEAEKQSELTVTKVLKSDKLKESLSRSHKRLFLLDYAGTFVKNSRHGTHIEPSIEFLNILNSLSNDPNNHIILFATDVSQEKIDNWFSGVNIGIVSDSRYKYSVSDEWKLCDKSQENTFDIEKWKSVAIPVFEFFTSRTPGSILKEKEYSISWYFGSVDVSFGTFQANELEINLRQVLNNFPFVEVVKRQNSIVVRYVGASKTLFVKKMMAEKKFSNPDFIFGIGDEIGDEPMFGILEMFNNSSQLDNFFTVTVGAKRYTDARYYVESVVHVLELFHQALGL